VQIFFADIILNIRREVAATAGKERIL